MKKLLFIYLVLSAALVKSASIDPKVTNTQFNNYPKSVQEFDLDQKEIQESFKLEIEFDLISKKETLLYKYELSFSFDLENIYVQRDLLLNNKKTTSLFKFPINNIAQLPKEDRAIISINAKGKNAGILFISRKAEDPKNFFGLSYPKQIGVFKNKWGWIGITMNEGNIAKYQNENNELISFGHIEIPNNDEYILYKKKFGFKKIPLGLKKLLIF